MAKLIVLLACASVAMAQPGSLTGNAGLANATAELRSEKSPAKIFRTVSDSEGVFRFQELPAGQYTLILSHSGFQSLTIKSIQVSDQTTLPPVQLAVASIGCSGPPTTLSYMRVLPDTHLGNVGGSVRLDQGPQKGNSPPVAGADVTLLCASKICGTTKTASDGAFLFTNVPAGNYSVRVSQTNFYPLLMPGFPVREGEELINHPIYLEHCPFGNCDAALRPAKPKPRCE